MDPRKDDFPGARQVPASVYLVDDDIDRHGEGCGCGVCDARGRSFGVGIFEASDPDFHSGASLLERVYMPSVECAYLEARRVCQANGWPVVERPES